MLAYFLIIIPPMVMVLCRRNSGIGTHGLLCFINWSWSLAEMSVTTHLYTTFCKFTVIAWRTLLTAIISSYFVLQIMIYSRYRNELVKFTLYSYIEVIYMLTIDFQILGYLFCNTSLLINFF